MGPEAPAGGAGSVTASYETHRNGDHHDALSAGPVSPSMAEDTM
jgi:hypothetical protein